MSFLNPRITDILISYVCPHFQFLARTFSNLLWWHDHMQPTCSHILFYLKRRTFTHGSKIMVFDEYLLFKRFLNFYRKISNCWWEHFLNAHAFRPFWLNYFLFACGKQSLNSALYHCRYFNFNCMHVTLVSCRIKYCIAFFYISILKKAEIKVVKW